MRGRSDPGDDGDEEELAAPCVGLSQPLRFDGERIETGAEPIWTIREKECDFKRVEQRVAPVDAPERELQACVGDAHH